MPIYEYSCTSCGHQLEAFQKISDQPLVACPTCGKDALTKLVSAAGFQLKGTGWYATDYRAKPKPKESGESPKESSADTKGEASKPKDPPSSSSSDSGAAAC